MKKIAMFILVPALLIGCGGSSDETVYEVEESTAEAVRLDLEQHRLGRRFLDLVNSFV